MSTSIATEAEIPSLSVRRRAASRELMRVEILAAAQHIIRTQGLDALSLRALAKSLGITAPALYEYFGNKDAILRAVFVQGAEIMLALMDETIAESPRGCGNCWLSWMPTGLLHETSQTIFDCSLERWTQTSISQTRTTRV